MNTTNAASLAMLTLAATLAVPSPASAETASAAASRVRAAPIEAHVRFLADDLLEGRGTGGRGYDLAARYVATQMGAYGLQPGGPDGSWLQSIALVESTPVLPAARAEILGPGGRVTPLEYGTHFLPGADYEQARVEIEAPLSFVGYGISAPELGHDDYAGVDVRGRIVVQFSGAPSQFAHNERAYYSSGVAKMTEAVRRGAVGLVTIDTPSEERRVPWTRKVQMAWVPRMRWLDAAGQPTEAFPELRGRFALSRPGAEQLFEGSMPGLDAAVAAAEAGRPQAFELPARLRLVTASQLRRTQSANVLGLLPGTDPELAREVIVVTAHLDHVGRGVALGQQAGDLVYNGAHDNASGIATLLETARALAESGLRLRRSVLFAAVTGEEKGLVGSDFLARHGARPGQRFVANVNMDMPLAIVALRDFVAFGEEHSSLGGVAQRAARQEGYLLTPDPRPEEVVFVRSDQFSFVRQGVPAIYLDGGTTAVDPAQDGKAIAARFLKEHYHQVSDDASQPMDYGTLAGLARVNVRIIAEVANAARAPTWNPGDFFGERFGQR